jgi:hypothetical protein
MRGDGVAVGDVGALSCWARGRRDTSGCVDGRGSGRERDARVVDGHSRSEQDAASEPGSVGTSVDDCTRIEHGGGSAFTAGSDGAHGMRGDGVAVGDVCAVSCGAWGRRITSGGDNVGGAGGERDAGLVGGHSWTEQDAANEPCRHGIGVDDGTRIGHGNDCSYSAGEVGAHGMRGDGVAVGDVGAVSCGARGSRIPTGGYDGGITGRELDAGVVG